MSGVRAGDSARSAATHARRGRGSGAPRANRRERRARTSVLQVAAHEIGPLERALHLEATDWGELGLAAALALVPVIVLETAKLVRGKT